MTTQALDTTPGGGPGVAPAEVYRYVPPDQAAARAATSIGDVLLRFALTFTGSLTLVCPAAADGQPASAVQQAGAALHALAEGLFVSSARTDHPRIESRAGHRFVHRTACAPQERTRRFVGDVVVRFAGGADPGTAASTLGYALDVTAWAPSDPPAGGWLPRHDEALTSIGAIVLGAVPIDTRHAALLLAG